MLIQSIPVGQVITIEVIWGTKGYDLKSTVVGTDGKALLVKPFEYQGNPVELDTDKHRGFQFNVYAIDEEGSRRQWKNVIIATRHTKSSVFYVIRAQSFKQISDSGERRDHIRMPLMIDGTVYDEATRGFINVKIKDISDNGIAFLADTNFQPKTNRFVVYFKDRVKDTFFDLEIHCVKVRLTREATSNLFGCVISEMNREMLAYMLMKKTEQDALHKAGGMAH